MVGAPYAGNIACGKETTVYCVALACDICHCGAYAMGSLCVSCGTVGSKLGKIGTYSIDALCAVPPEGIQGEYVAIAAWGVRLCDTSAARRVG